jgi:DNA polymerase III subunit beta
MQLKISKRELERLAARCQGVADKKSTMPVLGNILLEATKPNVLRLAATDLYLSVSGTATAEVTREGSIAVGARDFFERVRRMPEGLVSLTTSDNSNMTLQAVGQPRRYTLHGIPGEDFPTLPEPGDSGATLTLKVETLHRLIATTHFSISQDETRLHLNSALFEWEKDTVRMVTTDGHRLSKMEARGETTPSPTTMLIPQKGILELKRLCEEAKSEGQETLSIRQSGPTAFFDLVGVQFGVKLVDAQFPPYDQVIPTTTSNVIRAPRDPVTDALRAVSIAASDRTGGVKLTLDKNVIRFASESPESGDGFDEVPVDYSGDTFTVGFNAKYFLDVLSAIDSDELTLGISGELDPAIVRPGSNSEGMDYLAVVMPMRI